MKSSTLCHFCQKTIQNFPSPCATRASIGIYFYYKQIHEHFPSLSLTGSPDCGNGESPRLTFSLQTNSCEVTPNNGVLTCQSCSQELCKIETLHQQLNQTKEALENQIRRLMRLQVNEAKENVTTCQIPPAGNLVSGTVVGTNNILESLKFLGNLCSSSTSLNNSSRVELKQEIDHEEGNCSTDNRRKNADISLTDKNANVHTELSSSSEAAGIFEEEEEPYLVKQESLMDGNWKDSDEKSDPLEEKPASSLANPPVNPLDTEAVEKPRTLNIKGKCIKPIIRDPEISLVPGAKQPRKCCRICSAMVSVSGFNAHVSSHRENTLNCPVCEKKFQTREALVRHQRTHSNIRSHSCNFCGAEFNSNRALCLHRRTHESILLPVKCDLCDMRLDSEHSLQRHKKNKHKTLS